MITLLNDAGASWADWFGPVIVQNTIFLLLVFGALHLLRSASARVRAAVAAVGVVKLAVPPFLTWSLPAAESGAETGAGMGTLLFPVTVNAPAPDAFNIWTGGLSLPAALLAAWASLTMARLGWVALQTFQLMWAVRDAEPLPDDGTTLRVCRRGVSVWRSAGIGLPLTLGPLPRRIYVPADWDTWPAAHRRAALDHELAHITRRDGLVKMIEIVVQAAYFFHPLVHLLVRNLRSWREMACDDAAVAPDPAARLDYSRFLAELAGRAPVPLPATESASTLFRGEGELLSRVSHQIREGNMKHVSKKRLVGVVALLVMAALPLSMVLADAPAPPAPPAEPAPVTEPAPVAVPEPAAEPVPPVAPEPAPEVEVSADAPRPADAPPPPPKRPLVNVTIGSDVLTVEGEPTDFNDFFHMVSAAAKKSGTHPVVVLETDGDVSMGQIHDVQADLLAAGLTDVIYTGGSGKKVKMAMPPAEANEKLAGLPEGMVVEVKVYATGATTVGGKKVAGADLVKVIEKELVREEHLVVALHTDRDTHYGAFIQVLDSLKKAGATRIAIQDPGR